MTSNHTPGLVELSGPAARNGSMTITFPDGTRLQADLSLRSADILLVAIPGQVATYVFTRMSGAWISEDDDPVIIEFQREKWPSAVPSDDSNSGKPRASRLIARLLDPSEGDLLEEMLSYLP
jgi:hypothetical protein